MLERRVMRFWKSKAVASLLLMAAIAIVVAGYGSSTPKASASTRDLTATTSSVSSHSSSGSQLFIDINGPVSDPFFQPMKVGADAAAKQFGATYVYESAPNYDNLVPDYVSLVQEAIARHPAGIVVWDCCGTALNSEIKKAEAGGIPVVVVSSGLGDYKTANALTFVGEDHANTGEVAGKAAAADGVKHLLCVNNAATNPDEQSRCNGAEDAMKAAGGTSEEMILPSADTNTASASIEAIQGYLRSHSDIDGIWTEESLIGDDALQAVKNLNETSKIKVSTLGLTNEILAQVKSGALAGATDAQQYLQGFYSLQVLIQYAKYKVYPTEPILPGSLEVTKANVDQLIALQKQYPGVRGGE
jgi:simple sugar transport system substrate-binding protein